MSVFLFALACGLGAPAPSPGPDLTTRPEGAAAERCAVIRASVSEAGFGNDVEVVCDADHAWLMSDTYPSHPLMTGITATNEQIPVPSAWRAPVALEPSGLRGTTSIDAALGVAVNGVPIYDYSSQGDLDPSHYDARRDTVALGQLDLCGGHAGRGDDYHYHAEPSCMIAVMPNRGDAAILGWGFDGYPLYGRNTPSGEPVAKGSLDVCNGQPDPVFGYRYHTSATPPYITQCLRGEVDLGLLERVPPLQAKGGGEKPAGTPLDHVQDLEHIIDDQGVRRMTYRHGGREYEISYAPGTSDNCWQFTSTTASFGKTHQEYCR